MCGCDRRLGMKKPGGRTSGFSGLSGNSSEGSALRTFDGLGIAML